MRKKVPQRIVHWFPWEKKDKPLQPGTYVVSVEDAIILDTVDGNEVLVVELREVVKNK